MNSIKVDRKTLTFKQIREHKGKSLCDIACLFAVKSQVFAHRLKEDNPKLYKEMVRGYKSNLFPVTFLPRSSKAFRDACKECTPIKNISNSSKEWENDSEW